jgi:hypothetical protein
MMSRRVLLLVLPAVLSFLPERGLCFDRPQAKLGGVFTYYLNAEHAAEPFRWNLGTSTPLNRSRLMLDLEADLGKLGAVYLKGASGWENSETFVDRSVFQWEQGHYSFERSEKGLALRGVLFKGERRFFTGDMADPLLYDDSIDDMGDNLGAVVDVSWRGRLGLRTIASRVGEESDEAARILYLRSTAALDPFDFSLSYLYEETPGEEAARAVFKTELTWFYKRASFILSYRQSGRGDERLFFPRGSFHFDRFLGDNFSLVLPLSGAFYAEARLDSIPLGSAAVLDFIPRYFAVKGDFHDDLGMRSREGVGYSLAAYVHARDVFLDGKLEAGRVVRTVSENEETEFLEAELRGGLKGGIDYVFRGGTRSTTDRLDESRSNRVLGAVSFHSKNMRNGIHFMARDIDTDYFSKNFAWDSRIVLNPEFAFDIRMVLTQRASVDDAVFMRVEFRPTQHIYAYFSFGRAYLGDSPFLLEDSDLAVMGYDSKSYTLSIRGDF